MRINKCKGFLILTTLILFACTSCSTNSKLTEKIPPASSQSSTIDSSTTSSGTISSEATSQAAATSASAQKPVSVTGISLSKTQVTLSVGQTTMPIVTMTPKNATDKSEIWTSSDIKIATVDHLGNIKGVNAGSCTVTVTSASNKSVKQTIRVTISPKAAEETQAVDATPEDAEKSPAMDSRAQTFSSTTQYLILVDLANQKVGIYQGSKGKWTVSHTFVCSSGTAGENATPKGTYTIHERGKWFFSQSVQEGGEWWTQFSGDFLFHSLPMDKNHHVVDSTLGKPASHGCIRLAIANAKWIYDNIPRGTTVNIY